MKRVLALVPSEVGYTPGQRSTIELWREPLEQAGFLVEFAPFETTALRKVLPLRGRILLKAREMFRSYGRRVRLLRDLSGFDAVYLYREAALIGPALLERWVARRGLPIIYTLDDPLYVPYVSPASGLFSYLKFFGKVATICKLSRVVIANSRHHFEYARRYCKDVRQIPSVIDGAVYRHSPQLRRGTICVGWSGSSTTAPNLRLVVNALAEVARRTSYRLHVIGGGPIEIPGVECTAQPWRAESEVQDLRQFDVGLIPLPDNEWNRRKFNLKVAQYMALGIVPVASPLGSNPDVIEAGVDGFLASTTEEWTKYTELLVRDAALRARMADRAAHKAKEKFTLESQTPAIVDAFRSAAP